MKKPCESLECRRIIFAYTFVFAFYLLCITGCGGLTLSSPKEVREFERAGPITPEVDVDRLLSAKIHTGYYRVVPGDVLELQMPAVLRVVSPGLSKWFRPLVSRRDVEPYLFRVSDAGTITLSIIGEMSVAGKKLTEVETSVVNAYYPKYVASRPSVVCKVAEYQTENVTVVGGVARPGLYRLRSDEMSLVAALMKSEGIIEDGASLITIRHAGRAGEEERAAFVKNLAKLHQDTRSSDIEQALVQLAENIEQSSSVEPYDNDSNDSEQKELINVAESGLSVPDVGPTKVAGLGCTNSKRIVLPVKGLNIPFADVALCDGDVVEVEKLNPEVFTVLGPVKGPGVFPYPPDVQYNLMQALAFAGGPDLVLDPRYVTIYRQDANGRIVSATFGLDRKFLANASNIKIKPGDVVSVEMTLSTRARLILKEMFYIRVGYDLDELITRR